MDNKTVEQLLDTVADYAERVDQAGRLEQEGSMAAAFALDELYENGAWVDEWLEQSPKPASSKANNWQADSRNRFTKWLEWKESERRRKAVGSQYAYRLMGAAQIARDLNLANGEVQTEITLRPLAWLRKAKRMDRAPEVWKRIVDQAGSVDAITPSVVKDGLASWKRDVLGGNSTGTTSTARERRARQVMAWRRKHVETVDRFTQLAQDALLDKDAWAEFEEAWLEIKQVARDTADRARAGAA